LLRPYFTLIALLFIALLAGAFISYPLFLCINYFSDIHFEKIISKTILLCGLIFSLAYCRYCDGLSFQSLGLRQERDSYSLSFLSGFCIGLFIFILVVLSLLYLNVYQIDVNRDLSITALGNTFMKAMITGLLVATIEETLFRGALFKGFVVQTNSVAAVLMISIVYAALHFLDFSAAEIVKDPGWLTGASLLPGILQGMFDMRMMDAFITLLFLGLLLGLIRLRTGNIIQCIGLHAGIVVGLKLSKYITNTNIDVEWSWLVNTKILHLGYLPGFYLFVSCCLYYLFFLKKQSLQR